MQSRHDSDHASMRRCGKPLLIWPATPLLPRPAIERERTRSCGGLSDEYMITDDAAGLQPTIIEESQECQALQKLAALRHHEADLTS